MKENPIILNIESATGLCSVCISKGDENLHAEEASEQFQHSKILINLIDNCLKTCDLFLTNLDAAAVSSGPGSYTSLRVGISTAKGICYALGIPLIAVDTLQSLALGALKKEGDAEALYCPMIDARRMEVYCSIFDGDNQLVVEPAARLIDNNTFTDVFKSGKKVIFCGNGAEKCQNVITSPQAIFRPSLCVSTLLPELAKKRYDNGEFEDIVYFRPFYLKPPNITVPKNMNLLKVRKIQ